MFCNYCGQELKDGETVCPTCGSAVDQAVKESLKKTQSKGLDSLKEAFRNYKPTLVPIAIVLYIVWYVALTAFARVANPNTAATGIFAMAIIGIVFGWKLATNVVEKVYNSILGGVNIIAPIMTFVYIALIKVGLRLLIAFFVGWLLAPYEIAKLIMKLIDKQA